MIDLQATDRALRIGQKRDVKIYRFVVDDTIEEKIYHRQIFKKFMADKVLQDPSKQKFFDQSSMHELFEMPRKSYLQVKSELEAKKHLGQETSDKVESELNPV
jgi:DNA excision repair protein ERCC-6